jgi:hypothetical protein
LSLASTIIIQCQVANNIKSIFCVAFDEVVLFSSYSCLFVRICQRSSHCSFWINEHICWFVYLSIHALSRTYVMTFGFSRVIFEKNIYIELLLIELVLSLGWFLLVNYRGFLNLLKLIKKTKKFWVICLISKDHVYNSTKFLSKRLLYSFLFVK